MLSYLLVVIAVVGIVLPTEADACRYWCKEEGDYNCCKSDLGGEYCCNQDASQIGTQDGMPVKVQGDVCTYYCEENGVSSCCDELHREKDAEKYFGCNTAKPEGNSEEEDQTWSNTTKACIRGLPTKFIKGENISFEDCKEKCLAETDFYCESVEYYPPDKFCQLNQNRSTSYLYEEPCYAPFEKNLFAERIQDSNKPAAGRQSGGYFCDPLGCYDLKRGATPIADPAGHRKREGRFRRQ